MTTSIKYSYFSSSNCSSSSIISFIGSIIIICSYVYIWRCFIWFICIRRSRRNTSWFPVMSSMTCIKSYCITIINFCWSMVIWISQFKNWIVSRCCTRCVTSNSWSNSSTSCCSICRRSIIIICIRICIILISSRYIAFIRIIMLSFSSSSPVPKFIKCSI